MPAIAVANVTATMVGKSEIGKVSKSRVMDLAFGDGALTYPTGGIPLSTSLLGMKRDVDAVQICDASAADGFVYKWDKTNNKILIFTQGALVGAAGAVAMDDFPVTAGVGTDAALSLSLTGSAGAGTHRWGGLKELAATDTPAATVLRVIVRGW